MYTKKKIYHLQSIFKIKINFLHLLLIKKFVVCNQFLQPKVVVNMKFDYKEQFYF